MRGAVSGGMALGLGELGLAGAFDAAYGASAGTLNALWLISDRVREGIPTWVDRTWNRELISRWRMLRGRPIVDIRGLIEQRYEQLSPGLFAAALRAGTELHPLATAVSTGEAVDLHPTHHRRRLRCSARCGPRPRCRCSPASPCPSVTSATSMPG